MWSLPDTTEQRYQQVAQLVERRHISHDMLKPSSSPFSVQPKIIFKTQRALCHCFNWYGIHTHQKMHMIQQVKYSNSTVRIFVLCDKINPFLCVSQIEVKLTLVDVTMQTLLIWMSNYGILVLQIVNAFVGI